MKIFTGTDGDKHFARIGENLQSGVGGFGDTPEDALKDLVTNLVSEMKCLVDGINTGNSGSCGDCETNDDRRDERLQRISDWECL